MFHRLFSGRTGDAAPPPPATLLKRILFFGAALLLLWLAVSLLPDGSAPKTDEPVYAGETGAIARNTAGAPHERSLFGPGYLVAIVLLAGGAAFAVYLRKQRGAPGVESTPIRTLGRVQIAQNQQLRLIACGGEVLLLGVTAQGIGLIRSFPEETFAAASGDGASSLLAPQPRFADLLESLSGITDGHSNGKHA